MTKLEYTIKGFGIRGFHDTKHEWEVRRNVYLPVTKDGKGCISVSDGEVRAGSMPTELQQTFREFLKTPTSKILAKAKSVQPVDKGIGKGQEIPCEIKLIGEDLIDVRNNIAAIKEAVNSIRKSRGDKSISIRKAPNKNKNNSIKRKRAGEYPVADGYSPKIKKPRASTSNESTEKEEFDKKRKITDIDCYRLSEYIGENWEFLAAELDLGQVQIDQIKEDNTTSRKRIQRMLCLWKEKSKDARICKLLQALKVCTCTVHFNKPAINDYFRNYEKC